MSVEQAKAFIERMKTDDAFREKVLAIEDLAKRLACIRGEGFECTEDEINEAAQEGAGGVAGGWQVRYQIGLPRSWMNPRCETLC